MKNSLYALGLTLSIGCASAVVRPYVGQQQAWPTASGSIVNVKYDMPIFTSLPPSPYTVLAEMRIESPFYPTPEEGHLPVLVKKAKQLNADALVFVEGGVFFSTSYGPREVTSEGGTQPTLTQVNRFNPESFKPGVTILAIQWLRGAPEGLSGKFKKAPEAPAATEQAPASEVAPAATEATTPPAATEAPAAEQPAETAPAAMEEKPAETPPAAAAPVPAEPTPGETNPPSPGTIQFR